MIPDQHLFSKLLAPTSSSFPLKLFTIISTLSPLQDLLPVTFCNPSKSLTTFKHQLKFGVIHSITMEWNTWISTSGGQLLHGQLLHGYSGVAATQITVNNGNNDKIDKMCHDYRREGFDSCNTVLAGSPRTIIDRLQRLLNASAVSSVILGISTEAWHICSTPSCTGSMFPSESSISSEWQLTDVSKARLPSNSWTAATPHRTLPVVSDFDLLAATILRSPSPVRWPGMRYLTTSETRRSVPTISKRLCFGMHLDT